MVAYYNEIDPYAAQWLRNLIEAGHIAPGVVDERSIEDVKPDELMGYTQCHFFAGVGVWSLALRRAGWPDNRPVWTGSCPCQPFSAAGAGAGFADPRHLWPSFSWLIKQCAPPVVIGEQVASKAVEPWVDLVQADLEAMGYAFGAVPFPSAGVGAPHIRDRLYWVADADRGTGRQGRAHLRGRADGGDAQPWAGSGGGELLGGLVQPDGVRLESQPVARLLDAEYHAESCSGVERLENTDRREPEQLARKRARPSQETGGRPHSQPDGRGELAEGQSAAGPVNGFWSAADWLGCRDGKWRPVEPGTFPLAHGSTSRVGRLRAYGNSICTQAAQEFIAAYLESTQVN